MYQRVINSETLTGITSTEAKTYLRLLNNTVEDALIAEQIQVAIKMAEEICNRAFTVKSITVKSSNQKFGLFGRYDSVVAVVAKVDNVVSLDYAITGDVQPEIEFTGSGTIYEVTYSTKAEMPVMVKQWVLQVVDKMFNRNSSDVTEPDNKILEPYTNLVWLP